MIHRCSWVCVCVTVDSISPYPFKNCGLVSYWRYTNFRFNPIPKIVYFCSAPRYTLASANRPIYCKCGFPKCHIFTTSNEQSPSIAAPNTFHTHTYTPIHTNCTTNMFSRISICVQCGTKHFIGLSESRKLELAGFFPCHPLDEYLCVYVFDLFLGTKVQIIDFHAWVERDIYDETCNNVIFVKQQPKTSIEISMRTLHSSFTVYTMFFLRILFCARLSLQQHQLPSSSSHINFIHFTYRFVIDVGIRWLVETTKQRAKKVYHKFFIGFSLAMNR